MAGKRKKYPKLPNGFGSIKHLGGNRRNPYAVVPPAKEFTENYKRITPRPICYVDDWMKGFAVLTAYKAGTYTPGMEKEISFDQATPKNLQDFTERILADYNRTKRTEASKASLPTFKDVYEAYFAYKYENNKKKTFSKSSQYSTRAAFKNCAALHDRIFAELRHEDLQKVIDSCPLKHSSLELIVLLFHQMYNYALLFDIVDRDRSNGLEINVPDDDEHGVPFSDEELRMLWDHKDDETVELILIMCYSGYRISAYKSIEINLEERYFKGGVKNKFSKERVVPIHSGIYDMVEKRYKRDGGMLITTQQTFRQKMRETLEELGASIHTPHDCRHTFSKLCEDYEVRENDRKRMLGHAFRDVTNKVYGHRDIGALRKEIEKIKICY